MLSICPTKLCNSSVRCWIPCETSSSLENYSESVTTKCLYFACDCHVLFLWNDSMVLIFILPCVAYLTAKVAGILCCLCYILQWCTWNRQSWRYEGGDTRFSIFSLIKLLERWFQLLKWLSCASSDLRFRIVHLLICSKNEDMNGICSVGVWDGIQMGYVIHL